MPDIMPKRGIKKRILNKVSALFSVRGAKQRIEIHGEQKDFDSPKEANIKTVHGVMSSMNPQMQPRGIRFSRRAVQRSKYLRQKFGVRKTVMGFSPRVGSITEEDESEITLWMLAENAENVISEGMAWLRNSEECCEDSTDVEQEDHEKILQMWIESNSFDNLYDDDGDKDIYVDNDSGSSSFSDDDDDDSDKQMSGVTDDDDDNDANDDYDEHQQPIINDYDNTKSEDVDKNIDVMQSNNISNSYPLYDHGTDSDDEDHDEEDEDDADDIFHDNEITDDSVNERSCSIYVDDESFDELDDDDDDDDDNDSDTDNEFAADRTEDYDTILSNPQNDFRQSSNLLPTIEMENTSNKDDMKDQNLTIDNVTVLDSASSEDYKTDIIDWNDDANMYDDNGCGERDKVHGDDDNQAESELIHDIKDSDDDGDDGGDDDDDDDDGGGGGDGQATVQVLSSRHNNDDDDHYDGDDNMDINRNDDSFSALNIHNLSKGNEINNTKKSDPDSDVKILFKQSVLPEKLLDEERTATECKAVEDDEVIPDDAVIGTVKEEIDEILSRISQIENDFNFMRKSMNEFRS